MTTMRIYLAMTLLVLSSMSNAAVMLNDSADHSHAVIVKPAVTAPAVTTSAAKPVKSSQAQLVNRIVAIVNNDVITQSQLNLATAAVKDSIVEDKQVLPSDTVLQRQVLQQLIDRKLQLQLAARNGITVADGQIHDQIAKMAKQQHMTVEQFYTAAPAHGFTKQELIKQVKENTIIQKLVQRAMQTQIHISDQDIDNYLHQLAHDPRVKKSYRVQDILIALPVTPSAQQITQAKDKAEVLLKRLHQGANFDKLSASSSQATNALKGGDLGWLQLGELPDTFEKAVVTMKQGEVFGPIRTANGFHIIKLSGVRGLTPGSALIQVELRQIVLKPTPKRSAHATAVLAKRLQSDLVKGRNFEQLATKYSQGGHAKKGGYIGWVDPKAAYPHLANAILPLNPGQFSRVLTANNSYYLIQVMAKRKAFSANKTEREQVKQLLYRKQLMEQMQTWLSRLRSQAYVKVMLPGAATEQSE
ncbi:MAG: hypothetical protein GY821_10120 [Gammaproteobacteria bacterium]|nr:hypothetical protein [Gammaproteobacteria bacterium]